MTIPKGSRVKQSKSRKENFDFEAYQKEVVSGLMAGKGFLGSEGLLKPLIAQFVEVALDAELTHHIEIESEHPTIKFGEWILTVIVILFIP